MDRELFEKIKELNSKETIKVLYVEDDEFARKETEELLLNFFNFIDTAKDGVEGLEKFESKRHDIIITDINMPKMDGLEMIKRIKKIDKKVPVLVITAFNNFEYLLESIKIGVYGYILKPIDINQLMESIYRSVEKTILRKERDRALALLKQYKKIIDESFSVTKTDLDGVITYANELFCKATGYKREELIGKSHNIVRHPDMPKEVFKQLWDTIQSGKIFKGVIKNKTKDGKAVYLKANVAPIFDEDGNIIEYIAVRDDITDIINPKKVLQDKINELKKPILLFAKIEDYDDLQNLYDEEMIEKMEEEFVKMSESLFPDGCRFDFKYNLGNGEFAFLKEYNNNKHINEFLRDIKQFQENVRNTPIKVGDYEYEIDLLLSFATEKKHMLKNAYLGIKKALKEKIDIIAADGLYQQVQEIAKKNIETLSMIRDAIKNKRIVSYYQPIYNNKIGRIEKYESLVRLIDKEGRVHTPFEFLDVAKIGKYYKQITRIVVENALKRLSETKTEISINLSAIDIEDANTRDLILDKLKENPTLSRRLVVELLEDEGINQLHIVKGFIKNLKEFGVKIAIDDFGSGYSNFSRLLEYEPDYIKIDSSLIKTIVESVSSRNIVEAIVSFANKQGYKTVAEFVSDERIFNIVKDMGIDYSQGYFIGKPLEDLVK
ncbi:EAL domain-containing protein [Hippea alviniae]|uniref:EAL domain-containing protein n=1 Tax=Hippea alviniae TaxID=1279027 RepID=UPI0003B79E60|nr:EAL domain-containing protein [Hippea alviniae]